VPKTRSKIDPTEVSEEFINSVEIRGRVSGEPEERVLPSGDRVVTWRVVVPRPTGGVDTLDIAAWSAACRRSALRLRTDHIVTITGALRRRFWKSPVGVGSRYEIEAIAIKRD
jgi:single-strand DNA-binding protein